MPPANALSIAGYRGLPVPHTFLRQREEVRRLGIIFPGQGYSCDFPLLYYATRLLRAAGADVLQVRYAYNTLPDFEQLPQNEQLNWLLADAKAAVQAGLAAGHYRRVTLVGKSLGTLALAHLLPGERELARAEAIWLTPLLRNPAARQAMERCGQRSLYIIGTADPHYDAALLEQVATATVAGTLVLPAADHSLEIPGDVRQSLRLLEQVAQAVAEFLT